MILRIPTIFLDFDGVLHSESAVGSRPFNRLPLLESALTEVDADFQIVISSSWRFHYSLEVLRSHLGSLQRYVVGVTPEIRPCSDMRYHEILEVVHSHHLTEWVAIDDSDWQFPPDCKQLIRCDPRTGLQCEQVTSLLKWLVK